jgi:hypothetical protein
MDKNENKKRRPATINQIHTYDVLSNLDAYWNEI